MPAEFRPNPKFDFKNMLKVWKSRPAESQHHSPKIDPVQFLKVRAHKADTKLFVERFNENDEFLKRCFLLLHTGGPTNPFREPHTVFQVVRHNHKLRSEMENQMRENEHLVRHVITVKGDIEKTSPKVLSQRCQNLRDYRKFVVPKEILSKYGNIKLPTDEALWKLLRPRIWFDLDVIRTPIIQLGRMVIELYTEAAPLVVLEFVRYCATGQCDRFKFLRLFPNLWLEGNIQLSSGRITEGPLEYDMRALNHDDGDGILSFPMHFVNGFTFGILCFTISSRPLKVLNGKRVAIGRVIKGMKGIELLQEYGTKNGKLKKEIRIRGCGVNY